MKDLGCKAELTNYQIDCLQNYYGIAIHANSYNLCEMREAVHACLFYVASSETYNYRNAKSCPLLSVLCRFFRNIQLLKCEKLSTPVCFMSLLQKQTTTIVLIVQLVRTAGVDIRETKHLIPKHTNMELVGHCQCWRIQLWKFIKGLLTW